MRSFFGDHFNYKTIPVPEKKKTITAIELEMNKKLRTFGVKQREIDHQPMKDFVSIFFDTNLSRRTDVCHLAKVFDA